MLENYIPQDNVLTRDLTVDNRVKLLIFLELRDKTLAFEEHPRASVWTNTGKSFIFTYIFFS